MDDKTMIELLEAKITRLSTENDRLIEENAELREQLKKTKRALYNLAKEFVDMQGYEKWDVAILAKEIVVPDYIKQAEKELAEERKTEILE